MKIKKISSLWGINPEKKSSMRVEGEITFINLPTVESLKVARGKISSSFRKLTFRDDTVSRMFKDIETKFVVIESNAQQKVDVSSPSGAEITSLRTVEMTNGRRFQTFLSESLGKKFEVSIA